MFVRASTAAAECMATRHKLRRQGRASSAADTGTPPLPAADFLFCFFAEAALLAFWRGGGGRARTSRMYLIGGKLGGGGWV